MINCSRSLKKSFMGRRRIDNMNIVNTMKAKIKAEFPGVGVRVKTINFSDLARCSKQFVTVAGLNPDNFKRITEIVREAGLILSCN